MNNIHLLCLLLSAVDTATIPKQNLLGMPNINIDPLMLNNMAPINHKCKILE